MNAPQEHAAATDAEMVHAKWRTSVMGELSILQTAFNALYKLPNPSKRRAMQWLHDALFDSPDGDSEELPF